MLSLLVMAASLIRLGQCKLPQRFALDPQPYPTHHLLCAEISIEVQARLVPFQAAPLQPRAINGKDLLCQGLHQQLPIPPLPVLRPHIQIVEVDTRLRTPGAVGGEVRRDACDRVGLVVSVHRLGGKAKDESLGKARVRMLDRGIEGESASERVFGCFDAREGMFVVGELSDHGEDVGNVCGAR